MYFKDLLNNEEVGSNTGGNSNSNNTSIINSNSKYSNSTNIASSADKYTVKYDIDKDDKTYVGVFGSITNKDKVKKSEKEKTFEANLNAYEISITPRIGLKK